MSFFKAKLRGSALLLTMFILAGILIVALSGSYIIVLGIKASGIQSQSTKAYFGAEAGAEKILWELRKNSYSSYVTPSWVPIFDDTLPVSGASYKVYFSELSPFVFTCIGEFQNTKRSVEIRM